MGNRAMKVGERYGLLVVKEPAGSAPNKIKLWLCACDCGGVKVVRHDSLRNGRTISCGCIRRVGGQVPNPKYIALMAERDALAAQVEALRDGIGKARDELSCCNVNSAGERLSHLLELTPQQHLLERDAQKGRDGFIAGAELIIDLVSDGSNTGAYKFHADEYADSIRQEKK